MLSGTASDKVREAATVLQSAFNDFLKFSRSTDGHVEHWPAYRGMVEAWPCTVSNNHKFCSLMDDDDSDDKEKRDGPGKERGRAERCEEPAVASAQEPSKSEPPRKHKEKIKPEKRCRCRCCDAAKATASKGEGIRLKTLSILYE